jgi:hypothetical protein
MILNDSKNQEHHYCEAAITSKRVKSHTFLFSEVLVTYVSILLSHTTIGR